MNNYFSKTAIVSLLLCLCIAPAAFADGNFDDGIFTYTGKNGSVGNFATVTGLVDKSKEIVDMVVPDYVVNGGTTYYVTCVGNNAFKGCTNIKGSVTLPKGLNVYYSMATNAIGSHAFDGCTGITSVTLNFESNPISIGELSFSGCTGLEELYVIRESGTGSNNFVTNCFEKCPNLKKVYVDCAGVPLAYGSTFDQQAYENATLYVREGYLEDFKASGSKYYCWPKFNKIETIESLENPEPVFATFYYPLFHEVKLPLKDGKVEVDLNVRKQYVINNVRYNGRNILDAFDHNAEPHRTLIFDVDEGDDNPEVFFTLYYAKNETDPSYNQRKDEHSPYIVYTEGRTIYVKNNDGTDIKSGTRIQVMDYDNQKAVLFDNQYYNYADNITVVDPGMYSITVGKPNGAIVTEKWTYYVAIPDSQY